MEVCALTAWLSGAHKNYLRSPDAYREPSRCEPSTSFVCGRECQIGSWGFIDEYTIASPNKQKRWVFGAWRPYLKKIHFELKILSASGKYVDIIITSSLVAFSCQGQPRFCLRETTRLMSSAISLTRLGILEVLNFQLRRHGQSPRASVVTCCYDLNGNMLIPSPSNLTPRYLFHVRRTV